MVGGEVVVPAVSRPEDHLTPRTLLLTLTHTEVWLLPAVEVFPLTGVDSVEVSPQVLWPYEDLIAQAALVILTLVETCQLKKSLS